MMGKFWVKLKYTAPPPNPPTDIAISPTSWSDNTAIGTDVATLTATNPIGGAVTYTLLDDPSGCYSIVGDQLHTIASLTGGVTLITVRCTNSQGDFLDEILQVEVTPEGTWTIATATQLIEDAYVGVWAGLADNTSWDSVLTATTSAQLSAHLTTTRSTANGSISKTKKWKIICDWDGVSEGNVNADGYPSVTDGWVDHGGGVYVVAAPGKSPAIGGTVSSRAPRGIQWDGIRFAKVYSGSGSAETQYGVNITTNGTWPAQPIMLFNNCVFGRGDPTPSTWTGNFNGGNICDYISFNTCTFYGSQNAIKCRARLLYLEGCDFQLNKQDTINVILHSSGTSNWEYYAYVWLKRCTFRNTNNVLGSVEHKDMLQTGNGTDRHLGYRVLIEDTICHSDQSYSGGGTQGCYNDDYYPECDSLYVIKNSIILDSSPAAFAYFSPSGTLPSFVDGVVFSRCGSVPSNFPGDSGAAQDMSIGITSYAYPAGGPWLYVTNSAMGSIPSTGPAFSINRTQVDPKNTSSVAADKRPEYYFVGRDFTRGGPAVNYISGKFGYVLPNEAGTQQEFVDDVMANWLPLPAYSGQFCPDLSGLDWDAPAP